MGLRKAAPHLLCHTCICTCMLLKKRGMKLDPLKLMYFVWWFCTESCTNFYWYLVKKITGKYIFDQTSFQCFLFIVLRNQKGIELNLMQMTMYRSTRLSISRNKVNQEYNSKLHIYTYTTIHMQIHIHNYTHAKLIHHPTRDLESLYTCVHASSTHIIDLLLSSCYLLTYRTYSQKLNFQTYT